MQELTHWKRPWCWERLRAGGEGGDRGWDGWMASPTQWTWVWVNAGSWWWTGRPGMLRFMGSQRVGHNWLCSFTLSEWADWLKCHKKDLIIVAYSWKPTKALKNIFTVSWGFAITVHHQNSPKLKYRRPRHLINRFTSFPFDSLPRHTDLFPPFPDPPKSWHPWLPWEEVTKLSPAVASGSWVCPQLPLSTSPYARATTQLQAMRWETRDWLPAPLLAFWGKSFCYIQKRKEPSWGTSQGSQITCFPNEKGKYGIS